MTTRQDDTEEHTAHLTYSSRCLNLNILSELPDNIARGIVFTDMVNRRAIVSRENRPSGAGCECATELSGPLPDNLGEVRWYGVCGVISFAFIRPHGDGVLNRKGTGAISKILTILAMGMHKFASICPRLGRGRQFRAPSERLGSMQVAEIVVGLEISVDIGIRYSAA